MVWQNVLMSGSSVPLGKSLNCDVPQFTLLFVATAIQQGYNGEKEGCCPRYAWWIPSAHVVLWGYGTFNLFKQTKQQQIVCLFLLRLYKLTMTFTNQTSINFNKDVWTNNFYKTVAPYKRLQETAVYNVKWHLQTRLKSFSWFLYWNKYVDRPRV